MSFINSILNVFVGSKSKKDLKEVEGIVKQILAFEKEFSSLSHDELRLKTAIFKNIIKDSRKPFNDIIEGLNSKIQSSNNIDEKDEYYTCFFCKRCYWSKWISCKRPWDVINK